MSAYIIQRGDTLFAIAAEYTGNGNRYREILPINPQITNPDVIVEGNMIELPDDWTENETYESSPAENLPAVVRPSDPEYTVEPAPAMDTTKLAASILLALVVGGALYLGYQHFVVKANPEEGEETEGETEEEDYEIEDHTPGDEDDDESDR